MTNAVLTEKGGRQMIKIFNFFLDAVLEYDCTDGKCYVCGWLISGNKERELFFENSACGYIPLWFDERRKLRFGQDLDREVECQINNY